MRVPESRIRVLRDAPPRPGGRFVLYWMVAARRPAFNFALDRAFEIAAELRRPLIVLEALRADHPYASDRIHRFVIDGMAWNARAFESENVRYFPYVEPRANAGRGLVESLAAAACAIVTDDWPWLFVPRMIRALADRVSVRVEAVDSNGLLPIAAADRTFARAFDFRRFLQRELPAHLVSFPSRRPAAAELPGPASVPRAILRRHPPASRALLEGRTGSLAGLPIDHDVPPAGIEGGADAGARRLEAFVERGIVRYADAGRHPDADGTSGLSPYLHFGHVGTHQVLAAIARRYDWSPARLSERADGKRHGWWGLGNGAETFLDQLVTWRELGFNGCARDPRAGSWESLPDWARSTLERHAADPRERVYSLAELESARTDDELWNAAQRQLVREGRIHSYLRMLWGKRVLAWTRDPREALERLFYLNDRFALDGRDPNSMSGITWIFGRYDRPWGPKRPIYGTVRYMTSRSTRAKLRLRRYLERYGDDPVAGGRA